MRTRITRSYELQCAHHLPNVPEGHKCGNVHGHTWLVEITVGGKVDPQSGWFMDFADVDDVWKRRVHNVLDHRDLNVLIPNPTTENLCSWIVLALLPELPGLARVAARENRRSCVTLDL